MLWSGTEPRRQGTAIWCEPDLNALDTDSLARPWIRSGPVRGPLSRSGAALNLTPELFCFIVAWHSSSGHAPSVMSHLWCLMENSCGGGAKVMMTGKRAEVVQVELPFRLCVWSDGWCKQSSRLSDCIPDGGNQRVDLCLRAKKMPVCPVASSFLPVNHLHVLVCGVVMGKWCTTSFVSVKWNLDQTLHKHWFCHHGEEGCHD